MRLLDVSAASERRVAYTARFHNGTEATLCLLLYLSLCLEGYTYAGLSLRHEPVLLSTILSLILIIQSLAGS